MKLSIETTKGGIVSNDAFGAMRTSLDKMVLLNDCRDNNELLVLRGHLAIEYFLNKIIEEFLPKGKNLTKDNNFSFSKKLLIVEGCNVLDNDTKEIIKEINKLRNKCAHQISYRVSKEDINRLLKIFPKKIYTDIINGNIPTLYSIIFSVLTDISYSVQLLPNNKNDKEN